MAKARARKSAVCMLVSGGYDSSMLLADLIERGFEVHPLYVRSGFYWEKAELHWLRRFLRSVKKPLLRPLTVAEAPMAWIMKGHWSLTGRDVPSESAAWSSVYLPGRNLVLLSQAGIYCAAHGIPQAAIAVLRGNPFADSKPEFLRRMAGAVSAALRVRLSVVAPYARLSKTQVARRHQSGYPFELTFSCIKPQGLLPCGRCSKCFERRQGVLGRAARRD